MEKSVSMNILPRQKSMQILVTVILSILLLLLGIRLRRTS